MAHPSSFLKFESNTLIAGNRDIFIGFSEKMLVQKLLYIIMRRWKDDRDTTAKPWINGRWCK